MPCEKLPGSISYLFDADQPMKVSIVILLFAFGSHIILKVSLIHVCSEASDQSCAFRTRLIRTSAVHLHGIFRFEWSEAF